MLSSKAPRTMATRLLAAGAVLTLGTLSLSACGGSFHRHHISRKLVRRKGRRLPDR